VFVHYRLHRADLLLNHLAKLWKTDFEALVEMMAWATVVYMDETGWKVSAKRCYAWVFTSLLHPQVEATNNISERLFRNSSQARNTGRTSKTPAGAQRRSVISSIFVSLRQNLPELTLESILAEVTQWCRTGQSLFRRQLQELQDANKSPPASAFPEPAPA